MKKKQERHILALSGGKDSAALAVYMREKYPEIPLDYVFIDSGCELPETYDYLNKIRAILNIKIIVIRPKRNFDYWLKYFGGVLPSPTNRWCTRLLKLLPYNKWLKNSYCKARIFSYVGLRADEEREGYRPKNEDIKPIHPFIKDNLILDDILHILKNVGIGLPSYYSWRQRSGCYFCYFQRDSEWRGLKIKHPDLFEKACNYEENHSDGRTYTWRSGGFLRELAINSNKAPILKPKPKYRLIESLSDIYKNSPNVGSLTKEERNE